MAPTFPQTLRKVTSSPDLSQVATMLAPSAPSVRRREQGLRGTDETTSLNHEAVLHHIAESSHNSDDHHVGIDGRRMTSHGSTTAESDPEGHSKLTDLDSLSAELQVIQADVQQMREARDTEVALAEYRKRQRARTAQAEVSKIPGPASPRTTLRMSDLSKYRMQDDQAASATTLPASTQPSRRSYAQAEASKGIRPSAKISSSYQAGTSTTSPVWAGSEFGSDKTSSSKSGSDVQQTYYDAVEHIPETPPSAQQATAPSGKLDKPSPHFAQPTQAATRRADETLRKESPSAKPSPDTPQDKSTRAKAPDFETDKRAAHRSQKRTSLPEGWMPSPEQASSTERMSKNKEQDIPENAASESIGMSQPSTSLRKKTSSYMSPTKSAQHRSIATIGQDKPTRMTPRIRQRGLRIETGLINTEVGSALNSPLRSAISSGSDDACYSAPSHRSSKSPSKKGSRSPKKASASHSQSKQLGQQRASSIMRLPFPLPEVANTTVTQRDSEQDLLDPIKEKLVKEDLLKSDPMQPDPSLSTRRASQRALLSPVFARLIKKESRPSSPLFTTAEATSIALEGQWRPRRSTGPSNEPISRLITGLRGQRSANIGKALAGDAYSSATSGLTQVADPAILYQGRKPSADVLSQQQDPAILYHGRKQSENVDLPQDPAIIFNSGPAAANVARAVSGPTYASQATSLRATAMNFVPTFLQDAAYPPEQAMQSPEYQDDPWWQPEQIPDYPLADGFYQPYQSPAGQDARHSFQSPGPLIYNTWHGIQFPREQEDATAIQTVTDDIQATASDLVRAAMAEKTPSVSPTSDDTSPPWSTQPGELASNRWTITGKNRRAFIWTGRDGLEIGFKGNGPDAEYDPNSPVMYRNYRANTKTFHMKAADRFPQSHLPGSQLPPNAPRLMREYAGKMGWEKVPCLDNSLKSVYGFEDPNIIPVAGLCSSCIKRDNLLHRIGGGVDLVAQI